MIIGTFKKTKDGFTGNISTFGAQFPEVTFEKIEAKGKGPNYIIHTAEGGELGAAWEKTSGEGKTYLSVSFKGPLLSQPINAALASLDKSPVLVWSEPRERDDA
jgi:uncharacterized protein (DUF736 family)